MCLEYVLLSLGVSAIDCESYVIKMKLALEPNEMI